MQSLFDAASLYVHAVAPREMIWIGIGFAGQFLFMMRFVWQWIQSERQKRSIIPIAFWYFSLAGGMTLFIYAIHRRDPVFITGQALGVFVYTRNLLLIRGERRKRQEPA
jgi:lipid-A-disaccharide synthase-like uncharacterized protein